MKYWEVGGSGNYHTLLHQTLDTNSTPDTKYWHLAISTTHDNNPHAVLGQQNGMPAGRRSREVRIFENQLHILLWHPLSCIVLVTYLDYRGMKHSVLEVPIFSIFSQEAGAKEEEEDKGQGSTWRRRIEKQWVQVRGQGPWRASVSLLQGSPAAIGSACSVAPAGDTLRAMLQGHLPLFVALSHGPGHPGETIRARPGKTTHWGKCHY